MDVNAASHSLSNKRDLQEGRQIIGVANESSMVKSLNAVNGKDPSKAATACSIIIADLDKTLR